MAYFKITDRGQDKYINMGMVDVVAAFYLEKGDECYEKYIADHYVEVAVIPAGGYPGAFDGPRPVDQVDFSKWYAGLPREWQLNPFCSHSIQFEHDVTDEEILYCFEWALAMTHENYLKDDLHCKTTGKIVNQNINYLSRKAFYEGVAMIPVAGRSEYMNKEMAKVAQAQNRVTKIKDVDFKKVNPGIYKVK